MGGVRFPAGQSPDPLYPVGTGVSILRVKRKRREADHSPPSSAEVKNVEIYLHFPICLHGTVLNYIIKYRDNFTFILSTSSAVKLS
jgi:hypothetical protein